MLDKNVVEHAEIVNEKENSIYYFVIITALVVLLIVALLCTYCLRETQINVSNVLTISSSTDIIIKDLREENSLIKKNISEIEEDVESLEEVRKFISCADSGEKTKSYKDEYSQVITERDYCIIDKVEYEWSDKEESFIKKIY